MVILAALLMDMATAGTAADPVPTRRPNVLLVVFDDLGTRLGCYGDAVAKSPHLDRLAARGTVFTRAYCQQPICGPSRASFMSGRRPDELRIWSMTRFLYDQHPDAVTMPQWFRQHGYTAMSIGKVLGGYGQESDFRKLTVPDRRTGGKTKDEFALPDGGPLPLNHAQHPLCESRDVPDEACFDTGTATLAITELRTLAKNPAPFFLAVGFFKPHTPYKVPQRYWDLHRREDIPAIVPPGRPRDAPDIAFHVNHEILGEPQARRTLDSAAARELRHGYYAAVSYADAQLGRLLDALDELGLRDHTIVVVLSDNGFHLGEHDTWGKMTLFDRDARVPLVISAPGTGGKTATTSAICELIDIFPTLTELGGLPTPLECDGVSLVPVLEDGRASVKSAALTQHPRPALYWGGGPEAQPDVMGYALRTERWSYHEWRDFRTGRVTDQEVYDQRDDPQETVNLVGTATGAAEIPALAERLALLVPPAAARRAEPTSGNAPGASRKPAAEPTARPPNIIVILADDMGYADAGFNGCKDIPTPHLDSMARNGIRFSAGYVTAPQCAPSRAGLLMGVDQNRIGCENNNVTDIAGLSEGTTFADHMRAAGYRTAMVGKWHLGTKPGQHPLDRGFDEYFGFLRGSSWYLPQAGEDSVGQILEGRKPVPVGGYLTDAFGERAVRFIAENHAKPFFLYLAFNAPHAPYEAPAEEIAHFAHIKDAKRRTYAAMVSVMDRTIGRVLAALEAAGVARNTLVAFLSDNGGPNDGYASNSPLHGWKGDTFEGGIRVPFVMQWPGTITPGQTVDLPVS
ncbi:MAG: sulfatase-like hydrolase/transferase, partial [Planctomycetaceae bacterium]